mgnify:CR=1 FL=1|jgi:hypothetical protein
MGNEKESIIGIIGGIILLVVFVPFLWNNPFVVDDIQHTIKEICGIDQKVLDALDDTVFETLDQKGRIVWNQFHQGKEVSKCDAVYFYNQLDDDNRKKINLKELTCNINECLTK